MMNEKALNAAAKAICSRVAAKAAIEAYLAALPDEDGLVKMARGASKYLAREGHATIPGLLDRLADALEAARAKQGGT